MPLPQPEAEIGATPMENTSKTLLKRPSEDIGEIEAALLPPAKRTRSTKGKGRGNGKTIS